MLTLPSPPTASQRTLTLAFVNATPEDVWQNRLVAMASRHKIYHVELHFESINQCFSIQW